MKFGPEVSPREFKYQDPQGETIVDALSPVRFSLSSFSFRPLHRLQGRPDEQGDACAAGAVRRGLGLAGPDADAFADPAVGGASFRPRRVRGRDEAAGLRFRHHNGATGKKYLPETIGAGAAFLDFDNDGWQDIFLVNSTSWPGEKGAKTTPALYRNRQDGTFQDVTREAGLAFELYGIGVAVGDYDNDGFADIYVTAVGPRQALSQYRQRQISGRDAARRMVGDPASGRAPRGLITTRDGKARPLRRQLCRVVARDRCRLHARRHEQVLLHAAEVQGAVADALSQPRRRHVRERDAARGPRGPREQGARRRAHRFQRRRSARPLRRQRHRAEPAL